MRWILVLGAVLSAGPIVPTPVPPEVAGENDAPQQRLFDVEIENRPGGAVLARFPDGSERRIGSVRRAAAAARPVVGGFHAACYVRPGIVCATAVNALHIKAGPVAAYDPRRPTANPAVNFNLAPAESPPGAVDLSPDDLPPILPAPFGPRATDATVHTDVPGGTGIFGGAYAPFTGTPVDMDAGAGWVPLEVWARPDPERPMARRIRMRVLEAVRRPVAIELENRAGGLVRLHHAGAAPRVVAVVLKRVRGTGNFAGAELAGVGELRANHPGVICLSTAPRGKLGGLQIIPANHARYMGYPWGASSHQWMVVASVASAGAATMPGHTHGYLDVHGELNFRPPHEGIAPLFASYLRPSAGSGRLALRVRRTGEVEFRACPEIVGRTEPGIGQGSPVDRWDAIRLELPRTAMDDVADDVEAHPDAVRRTAAGSGPRAARFDAAAAAAWRRVWRVIAGPRCQPSRPALLGGPAR
jgi:hypothetical protein